MRDQRIHHPRIPLLKDCLYERIQNSASIMKGTLLFLIHKILVKKGSRIIPYLIAIKGSKILLL